MTKDEALKMAIAEIEGWIDHAYGHTPEECADNKAIQACKEALEQPAQEPVGKWESKCKCDFRTKLVGDGCRYCQTQDFIDRLLDDLKDCDKRIDELEMKEWQGLSDDEIDNLLYDDFGIDIDEWFKYARAIEAKLKEKNHG